MTTRSRIVAGCLAIVVLCLAGIGWVSGTMLRSMIQAVPAILALAAMFTGYSWSSSATIPIFSFWMIMVANALFVGRLQHTPSALELCLTIATGLFSLAGLVSSFGISRGPGGFFRLIAAVVWFALQVAALFASIRVTLHR